MDRHTKIYHHLDLPTRHTVGMFEIFTAPLTELTDIILCWLQGSKKRSRIIGYINPHVYNLALVDAYMRNFIYQSDILCVDGVGISIACRVLFGSRPPRVVATHLLDNILKSLTKETTVILIGATDKEIKQAARAIRQRSLSLRIVQAIDGFRDVEEYTKVFHRYSNIDAVLVGMGSPKSERVLLNAYRICRKAVCWNVGGGSIQIYAGTKRRSPILFSKLGCEWIHRFYYEPHVRSRIFPGGIEFTRKMVQAAISRR